MESLPIANASEEIRHQIVNLVDCILKKKVVDSTADTKGMENKIDLLVYQLYGLTYDEVLIVDPETPIKREKYESMNPTP